MYSQPDNCNIFDTTPVRTLSFQEDDDFWRDIATAVQIRRQNEHKSRETDVHGVAQQDMHMPTAQRAINALCDMPRAHGDCQMQCASSLVQYPSDINPTMGARQETPSIVLGALPPTCCTIPNYEDTTQQNARCTSALHGSPQHARCTSELHDTISHARCSTQFTDNLRMHGAQSTATCNAHCTASMAYKQLAQIPGTAFQRHDNDDTKNSAKSSLNNVQDEQRQPARFITVNEADVIALQEHNRQLQSQLLMSVTSQNKEAQATQQGRSSDTIPHAQASQYVKIRKFTGSDSLQTFLSQFESAALFNRWDERAKHAHLLNSLGGEAADSILDSGQTNYDTYHKLVTALRSRFGDVGGVEKFREDLRNMKQQLGENLQTLQLDIRRLTAKAYPGTSPDTNSVLACNAFIDALLNREIALKIREKDVNNLDEAYVQAMRLESLYGEKMQKLNQVSAVREAATQKSCDKCPICSRDFSSWKHKQRKSNRQFKQQNFRSNFQQGYNQRAYQPQTNYNQQAYQTQTNQPLVNAMPNYSHDSNPLASNPYHANGTQYRQSGFEGPCFTCNAMGHYARNCPYKYACAVNQTYQSAPFNVQTGTSIPPNHEVQFYQVFQSQTERMPTYLTGQIQG
jgi:transposase-like protein